MTAYGQAITTKWYRETDPKQMTKYDFAQKLIKALRAVGMVPIRQYWPTFGCGTRIVASVAGVVTVPANLNYRVDLDSMDVTTLPSQFATPNVSNVFDDGFYLFDYPTTETFAINGVLYRPCIVVVAMHVVTGSNSADNGTTIQIRHCRRRADRVLLSDVMTLAKSNFPGASSGQNNFGFGNSTDGNDATSNFGAGRRGAGVANFWNWKPNTVIGDASHQGLLSVKNFHVVLSKTGLLIQVGNGTTRFDSNNILNCGFYFGGARVPGRARVPAQDDNLNLIDPVVFVPHGETEQSSLYFYETSLGIGSGTTSATMSGTHPLAWALGCQHGLLFSDTLSVVLRLYNIENLQRPFYPFYDIDTKGSPRQVDAVGSHVLNRVVYMTFNSYGTNTYFGPIDTSLRIEPVPAWEDIWTFPWWRVADRSAPEGEYVDPSTGINWWLYYTQNMNCMFAAEVEGITKLAVLPTYAAPAFVSETLYSLASGFGGVVGATVTMVQHTGAAPWVATPATDEATRTTNTTSEDTSLTFVVPGNTGDSVETCYQLSYQMFNRATASGQTVPLTVQVSRDGGTNWIVLVTHASAGNDTGNAAYNYATYTLPLPKDQTVNDFRFRFRVARNGGTGTATTGVKDVRVQKLQ
ncbi:MAG: hypothetical protein H0X45_02090 [Planctomycetes bacterium]|nr:hypothetical protein [Planctomycetota bacterium]